MKKMATVSMSAEKFAMPPGDLAPTQSGGESAPQFDGAGRAIHMLVFTTLYPNSIQPRHGVFVEERLRHLVGSGHVYATVVAPVPWFPFRHRRFGAYASFAKIPARERRHGIEILHPRYPVIPKIGMNVAPFLLYRSMLPVFTRLLRENLHFDFIDAHYLYPDGIAAVALGRAVGKPVVVTARGNDVTLIPRHALPRRQILRAVGNAAAVVTVSRALRSKLVELGAAADRITVLRNGVDLDRFDSERAGGLRNEPGLSGPVWLTVGHMIERKGMRFVIEALARVPDATLLIAGDGPEERSLRVLADQLGVNGRIRFLGAVAHADLRDIYNSADALFLASSREGMPNVVLESLACGTPVVAAPFAGVEELVNTPEAGEVADARTADALFAAWQRLWRRRPDRAATRRFAESLGWGPVVEAQCALYAKVLAAHQSAQHPGKQHE